MNKQFFVYILASKRNGTLYTGITSDLVKRVWQHKNNSVEGFTKKYNVKTRAVPPLSANNQKGLVTVPHGS
jgi:putative endonuclease